MFRTDRSFFSNILHPSLVEFVGAGDLAGCTTCVKLEGFSPSAERGGFLECGYVPWGKCQSLKTLFCHLKMEVTMEPAAS